MKRSGKWYLNLWKKYLTRKW